VVYSLATFVGFDSAAQLGEEAENPRRVIPRAVVLAALLIGLFYVFAMYTAVVAWGPDKLSGYLASPNPWRQMGNELGTFFGFLVDLAILNSLVALTQAGYNATTRLLFAMARARTLPTPLAWVHPRHHTPYIAAFVTAALSTIAMFIAAWKAGSPFNGFVYMITIVSLAFISLYIITCIACGVYYLTKGRDEFNPLLQIVAPLIGLVLLVPTLYYSGNGLVNPAAAAIPTLVVWMILGILLLIGLRMSGRDIASETRRWTVAGVEDDSVAAEPAPIA
jgi:amino acid transporter